MSATEATVAAPAEEVKVVETPAVEPATTTEAPAAEQPAPATEEVVPAAVRFFFFFSCSFSATSHTLQEAPKEEEPKAAVSVLHATALALKLTCFFSGTRCRGYHRRTRRACH